MTNQDYILSVGQHYTPLNVNIGGKSFQFHLWVRIGVFPFGFVWKPFFHKMSGGIFVFDLTNIQSLKSIAHWIRLVKESNNNEIERIPIMIVGNKVDLEKSIEVPKDMVLELNKKYKFIDYFQTSAITGLNVKMAFMSLIHKIIEKDTYP